ncbi:unnamed protein product, partial [Amoebophrya sp. A25]
LSLFGPTNAGHAFPLTAFDMQRIEKARRTTENSAEQTNKEQSFADLLKNRADDDDAILKRIIEEDNKEALSLHVAEEASIFVSWHNSMLYQRRHELRRLVRPHVTTESGSRSSNNFGSGGVSTSAKNRDAKKTVTRRKAKSNYFKRKLGFGKNKRNAVALSSVELLPGSPQMAHPELGAPRKDYLNGQRDGIGRVAEKYAKSTTADLTEILRKKMGEKMGGSIVAEK